MLRPRRNKIANNWLNPEQLATVDQVTATLRPEHRHRFRMRVSQTLRLSVATGPHPGPISDALLERAIAGALRDVAP